MSQFHHTYAPRDSIIIPLSPDDARWLLDEMRDREQHAIELVALHRRDADCELLARIKALRLRLEDDLGLDHVVRRPFVPVEERSESEIERPSIRWIPITTRAPDDFDDGGSVLVMTEEGVVGETNCLGIDCEPIRWANGHPIEGVTHWSPLPKPLEGHEWRMGL